MHVDLILRMLGLRMNAAQARDRRKGSEPGQTPSSVAMTRHGSCRPLQIPIRKGRGKDPVRTRVTVTHVIVSFTFPSHFTLACHIVVTYPPVSLLRSG
jgi:hypothetical protein